MVPVHAQYLQLRRDQFGVQILAPVGVLAQRDKRRAVRRDNRLDLRASRVHHQPLGQVDERRGRTAGHVAVVNLRVVVQQLTTDDIEAAQVGGDAQQRLAVHDLAVGQAGVAVGNVGREFRNAMEEPESIG